MNGSDPAHRGPRHAVFGPRAGECAEAYFVYVESGKEKALLLSDVISIVTRLTGEPDVIKSEYKVK